MKKAFVLTIAFMLLGAGIALGDEATLSPIADAPVFGYSPNSN